jgi:hypothetical protein
MNGADAGQVSGRAVMARSRISPEMSVSVIKPSLRMSAWDDGSLASKYRRSCRYTTCQPTTKWPRRKQSSTASKAACAFVSCLRPTARCSHTHQANARRVSVSPTNRIGESVLRHQGRRELARRARRLSRTGSRQAVVIVTIDHEELDELRQKAKAWEDHVLRRLEGGYVRVTVRHSIACHKAHRCTILRISEPVIISLPSANSVLKALSEGSVNSISKRATA